MISAFDSFLSYLNTELAGTPRVNWVRTDSNDNNANVLQENALNVSILSIEQDGSLEDVLISLDIVVYGEREAFRWAKRVRDVLLQQTYCREYDYDTNASGLPVTMNQLVFWHRNDIAFTIVQADNSFVHLNTTFPLCHTRQ